MKFEKLRLTGFKSFVEPTEFVIEPGLTGVVGPNGCGKSNLVEALRWVMGENSYKDMRASGMEDVIFSGSATAPVAQHRPRSRSSSTMPTARAPAAFNDAEKLEISRRIEREQGSTYRINGREVRARDVQLLFADASTGARSPALVRQGQIGEIIAAKPRARRRILEEAAGISGLHSRRHEAELRLKGRRGQSRPGRGRPGAARRADRQPQAAGAAGEALPRSRRRYPEARGAARADRPSRRGGRGRRSRAPA